MNSKTPLVVVCGPTACGKTALSIELAKRLNGEIVSADSMQVYRYMRIGTARPTQEEMQGIPHHLLAFLEPEEKFSVAQYAELARNKIDEIATRGRLPILAGGTGLYIRAVTDNIRFEEIAADEALRSSLREQAQEKGNEFVWKQLLEIDPPLAQKLHPNNMGRIIRAIEVYRLTGVTMTEQQRRSRLVPSNYDLCMIGLDFADRSKLYERIDQRVDQMVEQGLLEEVGQWCARGFSKTAAQAIGYKELFPYLAGECDLQTALEAVKRETRRYAKRQLTWLRRDQRIHWFYPDQTADFTTLIEAVLRTIDVELERRFL